MKRALKSALPGALGKDLRVQVKDGEGTRQIGRTSGLIPVQEIF